MRRRLRCGNDEEQLSNYIHPLISFLWIRNKSLNRHPYFASYSPNSIHIGYLFSYFSL